MDQIRKLENSVSIVQSTIHNGIYQEVAFKPQPNWCTLLSEYNLAFKQLDSVWADINPIFQLYEVVPAKPTEIPAEIPCLLCTTIPSEDSKANVESDSTFTTTRDDILALIQHNQSMKRVLSDFSEKSAPLVKVKRQRLNSQPKTELPNELVKKQLALFR